MLAALRYLDILSTFPSSQDHVQMRDRIKCLYTDPLTLAWCTIVVHTVIVVTILITYILHCEKFQYQCNDVIPH